MQSQNLALAILHCTATPEGRSVSPDDIRQWHLGPLHNADGTVVYQGKTYPSVKDLPNVSIAGIDIKKLTGRGWKKVGYSDMILLDGSLVNLTPYDDDDIVEPWEITNGVSGINGFSRHLVYAGGMDRTDLSGKTAKDTRTPAQKATMEAWVRTIIKFHPQIRIAGHNQFAKKACPSFHVPMWLESIGIPRINIYKSPNL